MILVDTFISDTLNTVDAVINHFVNNAYTNFVQFNAATLTLIFTLYVILIGYQFLHHHPRFNLSTITKHLIVMLCVYGLIMNWNLYDLFIYNIFTNEPGHIAKIFTASANNQMGSNLFQALDHIYELVIKATISLFGQVNFSAAGLAFILYGLLVFLLGSCMCVFVLLLFIYAKMMMAVTLALGPIFILFLLWESTKGMFNAWLNKLITLALIPIVTSAILVLMLSVIHVTLPNLNVPANELQFYGIAPFLGLSLATALILAQVFRICSALGGGMALVSISAGATITSHVIQKSGLAAAGRSAAHLAKRKARQIKQRFSKGHRE